MDISLHHPAILFSRTHHLNPTESYYSTHKLISVPLLCNGRMWKLCWVCMVVSPIKLYVSATLGGGCILWQEGSPDNHLVSLWAEQCDAWP